jgi:hypothetical protein
MLVYKYRGGDDKIFERDLNSLEKNYFWSSNFNDLNDPLENSINEDVFKKEITLLDRIFGKKSKKEFSRVKNSFENLLSQNLNIGIYSLSKSFEEKLLWSYYANAHKGFCIEYDLDKLLTDHVDKERYSFPVIYKKSHPKVSLLDIPSISKSTNLVQKAFGTKSMEWEHEKEYRIVTNEFGKHNYDYKAVKSIYFGLKMGENEKNLIIDRLRGRGIKYYQMIQLENNYGLKAVPLENNNDSEITYLTQISNEITGSEIINYSIIDKFYKSYNCEVQVKVELENKISKETIMKLSNMLKEHLFQREKKIYIYYYLKNEHNEGVPWSIFNFSNGEREITINDFTQKNENKQNT